MDDLVPGIQCEVQRPPTTPIIDHLLDHIPNDCKVTPEMLLIYLWYLPEDLIGLALFDSRV